MRRILPSLYRLVACLLMMTVMTSSIAMAAYACPQAAPALEMSMGDMTGMPCAEMDKVKPVHCAALHSGADLALEHLAAAPALTPIVFAFIRPAPPAASVNLPVFAWSRIFHDAVSDPPYLRTLRLRI
jgi:hypothetical protein